MALVLLSNALDAGVSVELNLLSKHSQDLALSDTQIELLGARLTEIVGSVCRIRRPGTLSWRTVLRNMCILFLVEN